MGRERPLKTETTDSRGVITTVTAIAFIVSAIDMIFYWNVFGINIFNHLTPSDILSRSIKPLSLALAGIAVTSLLEIQREPVERKLDNIIDNNSKVDKTLNIFLNNSPLIFAITGILIQVLTESNVYVFFLVAFVTTSIMKLCIEKGVTKLIEDKFNIPFFAMNMIVSIGGLIVAHSAFSALQINEGHSYQRAEVFLINKHTPIREKYIGETKDTLFLQSFETNEIIEIRKQSILKIRKSEKDCNACQFDTEK